MTPTISFTFPLDATHDTVAKAINAHFGAAVPVALAVAATYGATPAAALPVGATPGTEQLDSQGIPWDERIHSSSKLINENGKWKQKKGAAPGVVVAVVAELQRARQTGGGAQVSLPINTPMDDDAKRALRLKYANDYGMQQAGPQPVSDSQLADLNAGKPVTVSETAAAWHARFLNARNEGYGHYQDGMTVYKQMTDVQGSGPDLSAAFTNVPRDPGHTHDASTGVLFQPQNPLDPAALFGGLPQHSHDITDPGQSHTLHGAVPGALPQSTTLPTLDESQFPGFSVFVAKQQGAGKFTAAQLLAILNQVGIENMAVLGTRSEMIPSVREMIRAYFGV